MKIKALKYYTSEGWKSLYSDIVSFLSNNALLRTNNLSDLIDKDAARENLELTGNNNNTHYHDSHYLPMFQALEDKVDQKIEDFENELNNKDNLVDYSGDIINLEDQKNGWYKWTGTIDSVYSVWIIQKMSSLYIATSINDPRIVLNSNNLTTWYSPYGYWHA